MTCPIVLKGFTYFYFINKRGAGQNSYKTKDYVLLNLYKLYQDYVLLNLYKLYHNILMYYSSYAEINVWF